MFRVCVLRPYDRVYRRNMQPTELTLVNELFVFTVMNTLLLLFTSNETFVVQSLVHTPQNAVLPYHKLRMVNTVYCGNRAKHVNFLGKVQIVLTLTRVVYIFTVVV